MENSLNFLGKREGFNVALRHFKGVTSMIKQFESKINLADIINQRIEEKKVEPFQVSSILNALLVDKYKYFCASFNLNKNYTKQLINISKIVKTWAAFDITLVYYHPQLGLILINPKNDESWLSLDSLRENELMVIYVGNFNQLFDVKFAEKCADELLKILNSEITDSNLKFLSESVISEVIKPAVKVEEKNTVKPAMKQEVVKSEASTVSKSSGKKKMSPQYGVTVSNELFHNGNVEAWKRIIRSYESKYSEIKVLIFYEGEQIHDINTLFKWGKVKHGTNIYICLLGPDFTDISKLRRYLAQGASSRYEDFLKGDPTKDMALF